MLRTATATLLLVACGPCEVDPVFRYRPELEVLAGLIEENVNSLLVWTGPQCLAEVEVTESAPDRGLSRLGREGWELSFHPDTASIYQVNRHLCAITMRNRRALPRAPRDLFTSDEISRTTRFLDVCQEGPARLAFIDQYQACGLPELTREEAYIQEVVFGQRPPPVASDLEVVEDAAIQMGVSDSLHGYTITREGMHALVLKSVDDVWRYGLERRSEDGVVLERDLPGLDGRSVRHVLGVDANTAAFLVRREGTSTQHDIVSVDRRSGAETWVPVLGELREVLSWSPGALIGEELFVAGGEVDGVGKLYAVSARDGRVRSIDLPQPEKPYFNNAVSYFWIDPNHPESLLVSYRHQITDPSSYDVKIYVFDRFLARFHTGKNTWTELLRTNTSLFEPDIYPLGVAGDGRVVLRIKPGAGGTLLGAFDESTDEISVSGDLCITGAEDYPSYVIGDTAYAVRLDDRAELSWIPFRIGR